MQSLSTDIMWSQNHRILECDRCFQPLFDFQREKKDAILVLRKFMNVLAVIWIINKSTKTSSLV